MQVTQYKITEVLKVSEQSYGKKGDQKRIAFKVEGYKNVVSVFTSRPDIYKVGNTVVGTIKVTDDGKYSNFEYGEPKPKSEDTSQSAMRMNQLGNEVKFIYDFLKKEYGSKFTDKIEYPDNSELDQIPF